MNESDLLAFEEDIAQEFAAGNIRSPIHLGGGNEQQLIALFDEIRPLDWVLCGWRSHYHCLLKGVPRDELKAAILAGHSVSLCFPEYRILCSGIVGGVAPIAVGIAWAIKQRGEDTRVHCFVGDMSCESGIFNEALKYANGHDLPVHWIIEDNGLSVMTDTNASWGRPPALKLDFKTTPDGKCGGIARYHYTLTRPHSGIGKWVRF